MVATRRPGERAGRVKVARMFGKLVGLTGGRSKVRMLNKKNSS